jgi:hypothetical protein
LWKVRATGWMENLRQSLSFYRGGRIGGRREKVRGVYGFSSLMKQKIKAKNYAVFCFAGKRFFFYIYDVITWEK